MSHPDVSFGFCRLNKRVYGYAIRTDEPQQGETPKPNHMKRIILHSTILIILIEIVGFTIASLSGPEINLVGLFIVSLMMVLEIILLNIAKTTSHE